MFSRRSLIDFFDEIPAAGVPSVPVELSITLLSPLAETAPGDAGGFPADRSAADATPIVVRVLGASTVLITVTAGDAPEAIAYFGGWRPTFAPSSSKSNLSGGADYSIGAPGTWGDRVVVSVFAAGGGNTALETWTIYAPSDAVETVPDTVPEGAHDYVAEAFGYLPWRLAAVEP